MQNWRSPLKYLYHCFDHDGDDDDDDDDDDDHDNDHAAPDDDDDFTSAQQGCFFAAPGALLSGP